jgi:hypothetical protein
VVDEGGGRFCIPRGERELLGIYRYQDDNHGSMCRAYSPHRWISRSGIEEMFPQQWTNQGDSSLEASILPAPGHVNLEQPRGQVRPGSRSRKRRRCWSRRGSS